MGRPIPVIAILDDEEDFRRALMRLLKAHGYGVASFATGEELIAETSRCKFDCVLLDLHMPGMSGFDVLAVLRQNAVAPRVIVITGHDDADCVERALALNAFECQRKPISAPTLLAAIERACPVIPR